MEKVSHILKGTNSTSWKAEPDRLQVREGWLYLLPLRLCRLTAAIG